MPDLIILGDCTVELWCEGHFTPNTPIQAAVGGETGRTCLAVVRRGLRTGLISRLGEDLFEPFLRSGLGAAGVDLSCCPTVPGINGVAFGYGSERNSKWIPYRADTAASALRFEDVDPGYIRQARVLYTSGVFQAQTISTRAAVRGFCELAAASRIPVVFSGCFNPRIWPVQTACEALRDIVSAVGILLLDVRHFRSWFGEADARRIASWGIQQGAKCAVVRGGAEMAVAAAGAVDVVPAPAVADAELDAALLTGVHAGIDVLSAVRSIEAPHVEGRTKRKDHAGKPGVEAVAFIDGGSRGNPGIAGAGVYFERNGRPWKGLYIYLGKRTNNFAEYSALLGALDHALANGVRHLKVASDSELLVRQLEGVYRVKDATLKQLYDEARQLIGRLDKFSIRHVPREQNKKADALANRAQDEQKSGEEDY